MSSLYGAKLYCGNRECQRFECVRHDKYVPFDILIMRENFKPDVDGNCKNILLEWEKSDDKLE